ncbi:hypothetical protein E2562_032960 [Oryza meyeriana var. granulata]|uniref:Uncharacterized protein n=1 Tax=Oryza meyeriana var. granulata TaxID=110450 RepID=A0A6G1D944_9ORYZ|nr:hypothetical protein E2562_032960 [Oryza meyeriana var. granulata]
MAEDVENPRLSLGGNEGPIVIRGVGSVGQGVQSNPCCSSSPSSSSIGPLGVGTQRGDPGADAPSSPAPIEPPAGQDPRGLPNRAMAPGASDVCEHDVGSGLDIVVVVTLAYEDLGWCPVVIKGRHSWGAMPATQAPGGRVRCKMSPAGPVASHRHAGV